MLEVKFTQRDGCLLGRDQGGLAFTQLEIGQVRRTVGGEGVALKVGMKIKRERALSSQPSGCLDIAIELSRLELTCLEIRFNRERLSNDIRGQTSASA